MFGKLTDSSPRYDRRYDVLDCCVWGYYLRPFLSMLSNTHVHPNPTPILKQPTPLIPGYLGHHPLPFPNPHVPFCKSFADQTLVRASTNSYPSLPPRGSSLPREYFGSFNTLDKCIKTMRCDALRCGELQDTSLYLRFHMRFIGAQEFDTSHQYSSWMQDEYAQYRAVCFSLEYRILYLLHRACSQKRYLPSKKSGGT
jgi:hypothetical protein